MKPNGHPDDDSREQALSYVLEQQDVLNPDRELPRQLVGELEERVDVERVRALDGVTRDDERAQRPAPASEGSDNRRSAKGGAVHPEALGGFVGLVFDAHQEADRPAGGGRREAELTGPAIVEPDFDTRGPQQIPELRRHRRQRRRQPLVGRNLLGKQQQEVPEPLVDPDVSFEPDQVLGRV